MEFGLFMGGYVPGASYNDPEAEHAAFMNEAAAVELADRCNWKYVWLGEHHCLPRYSHLAASEVMMGYLANSTSKIHLGAGIFNLSPRVNHPIRVAERAALIDNLSGGRFECGTGRGAGSHELSAFGADLGSTRAEWDEVIWQIPRMWREEDYTFDGESFSVASPHNVLPKPFNGTVPPLWVACGNPPTYEKAGRHGIGALGFTFAAVTELAPLIEAYRKGVAECIDPVGPYINDNVMITNELICFEDRHRARELAIRPNRGLLYTNLALYHDSIPHPEWAPRWPDLPLPISPKDVDTQISVGALLCGNPDEVCEQLKKYEEVGMNQLAFHIPFDLEHDQVLEMIEIFGTQVIPEFDKDEMHSTTRNRLGLIDRARM